METYEELKNEHNVKMPQLDLDCFNIYECPVTSAMDVIGGKWKPMVIYLIHLGENRFGKLSKLLEGISKRTLTKLLRDLERDGILHREVFPEVPPRVEYSLTEKGVSLLPVIKVKFAAKSHGYAVYRAVFQQGPQQAFFAYA